MVSKVKNKEVDTSDGFHRVSGINGEESDDDGERLNYKNEYIFVFFIKDNL